MTSVKHMTDVTELQNRLLTSYRARAVARVNRVFRGNRCQEGFARPEICPCPVHVCECVVHTMSQIQSDNHLLLPPTMAGETFTPYGWALCLWILTLGFQVRISFLQSHLP